MLHSIVNDYSDKICDKDYGREVLKTLVYLMHQRKNFAPSLSMKLFEFMLTESPLKTYSLKLATKLINVIFHYKFYFFNFS